MIRPVRCFLVLFTLAVAIGCAGGGGSSLPPAEPPGGGGATGQRHHAVHANFELLIPPKSRARIHDRRSPAYISANTRSLTVGVQGMGASPWPSPMSTLLVVGPKACSTPTSGAGGEVCQYSVPAYQGTDEFSFAAYAEASPGPTATPLSVLNDVVATVVQNGTPLSFTLEGVVHDIVLGVPSPESSSAPTTQVVPLGQSTALPLTITPRDASGNDILTDTFAAPIRISALPSAGVTLSLAAPCTGDSAQTGASITLGCGAELSHVTVNYSGALTPASSSGYVERVTISASPEPSTGAPSSAAIAFAGGEVVVATAPTPAAMTYGIESIYLANAPNGATIYFAATDDYSQTYFGSFSPTNAPSISSGTLLSFPANGLQVDGAANPWISSPGIGDSPNALECMNGGVPVPVPLGGQPNSLGVDTAGNLWYSDGSEPATSVGEVPTSPGCGGSPVPTLALDVNWSVGSQSIAASALGISLAVDVQPTDGSADHAIYPVTGSGVGSKQVDFGTSGVAGIVSDPAFNLYALLQPASGSEIETVLAGSSAANSSIWLASGSSPYGLGAYSTANGSARVLALSDDDLYALHYIPIAAPTPAAGAIDEVLPDSDSACSNPMFDTHGAVWVMCVNSTTSTFELFRTIVTSTWAPVAGTVAYYGSPNSGEIGIVERGDSSPFTVSNISPPDIVATAPPWPSPGNFSHDIPITIEGSGTVTVTIVDKYGRSQAVTFTVARSGGLRRHPRHRRFATPAVGR